jgi:hypothetical protein
LQVTNVPPLRSAVDTGTPKTLRIAPNELEVVPAIVPNAFVGAANVIVRRFIIPIQHYCISSSVASCYKKSGQDSLRTALQKPPTCSLRSSCWHKLEHRLAASLLSQTRGPRPTFARHLACSWRKSCGEFWAWATWLSVTFTPINSSGACF